MGLQLNFLLYGVIESLKLATWSSQVRLALSGGKRLQPFESWCLSFCCPVALKSPGYLNATEKRHCHFSVPSLLIITFFFSSWFKCKEVFFLFFTRSSMMILGKFDT